MGAGVWGWNPQLGDESPPVRLARSGRNNFRKKKVFQRTLFEQKFSYIYMAYFSFEFSFEIFFFFRKNGIRKKAKNEKNSKERISKQIFQFRKNVIRSNDLVPSRVLIMTMSKIETLEPDPNIESVKNCLTVENFRTNMTYFCNCPELLDSQDLGFETVQFESLVRDHVKNWDFRVSSLLRLGSRICWLSIISQLSNLGL